MIQKELLTKINWACDNVVNNGTYSALSLAIANSINALRAVVELHKPENVYLPNGLGEKIDVCEDCQDNIGQTIYPCPTIQAIEKEFM